ncbi:MAG: hypothetical protein MJ113_06525 [Lachnospiraceae bacterium]|nr:hypothetical protein [Lachnospiraceae bacterium]
MNDLLVRKDFEKGFGYVNQIVAGSSAGMASEQYLDEINAGVDSMISEMLSKADENSNMDAYRLQGFLNEIWHKDTYNINADISNSPFARAIIPGDKSFATVDVQIGNKEFALKSYADVNKTVKAVSETSDERFKTVLKKHPNLTKLDYKKTHELGPNKESWLSIYQGQTKVISTEQLSEARRILTKKIAELSEKVDNPAIASNIANDAAKELAKYKEVLDTLTDRVGNGFNQSLTLTHADAMKIAVAAKEGNLDRELLESCGLDVNKLIGWGDIAFESFIAGFSATALSTVISFAPVLTNVVVDLVKSGEINPDELKRGGLKSLKSSPKSFLIGGLSSAISVACKTGKFGTALLGASAGVIGSMTAIAYNVVDSSIKMATGSMSQGEMARDLWQKYLTTAGSILGGMIAGPIMGMFPVACMLGSLVGSAVGGVLFSTTDRLFTSLCIESGCTFFGLVEQDYTLPIEVVEYLGIEQLDFDKLEVEDFEADKFVPEMFAPEIIDYDRIGMRVLRRDLIEIGVIGYVD